LNLSMMLDPLFDAQKEERRKERDNNKGRHFEKRTPFERRGSGGPHFPRSRYVSENKRKY